MESELPKSTVYFDGSCSLCRAEIGYYRRKDQDRALCFVDISETGAVPPEGITQERAMKRFHVRASDGRVSLLCEERLSRMGSSMRASCDAAGRD